MVHLYVQTVPVRELRSYQDSEVERLSFCACYLELHAPDASLPLFPVRDSTGHWLWFCLCENAGCTVCRSYLVRFERFFLGTLVLPYPSTIPEILKMSDIRLIHMYRFSIFEMAAIQIFCHINAPVLPGCFCSLLWQPVDTGSAAVCREHNNYWQWK